MNSDSPNDRPQALWWWPYVIMAAFLLPVIILFVVPAQTSFFWLAFWFITLLIFNLIILWLLVRSRTPATAESAPAPPRILQEEEFPAVVRQVMDVHLALEEKGARIFRGDLRESASNAFEQLKSALGDQWMPLVQKDPELQTAIVLLPAAETRVVEKPIRLWLHWLLFAITFLTTTWVGALHQGINLFDHPDLFALGLPYSIGLLSILGFHELGHYFTARHYQIKVTPPFFIPVPFALGTFGAFIAMRSPAEDRRSLFDVAVAGPLAGLVLAIPALIIGLQSSTVVQDGSGTDLLGGLISSSILFGLIAKFALGAKLVGSHGKTQLTPSAGSIFVWPGLLFWALIVFFIARRGAPPLNDVTPVSPGRMGLGLLSFLILALILIPMPEAFWAAMR